MSELSLYYLNKYKGKMKELYERFGGKCTKCGSTNRLQFDHIDPATKKDNITRIWNCKPEMLEAELAKCQLLCDNCHATKTQEQRYGKRQHGTTAMYYRGKCRCEECVAAYRKHTREYLRRYRAR